MPTEGPVFSECGVKEVIYKLAARNSAFESFGILLDGIAGLDASTQKELVDVISGAKFARQFGKSSADSVWLAPMVITCSDHDLPHLTRVARVCRVVEFVCPSNAELTTLFEHVSRAEHLHAPEAVKQRTVEGCGGDVRRLLNALCFLAIGSGNSGSSSLKDVDLSVVDVSSAFYNCATPFDLTRQLIKACHGQKRMRLSALEDLLETNPDQLARMLQENGPHIFQQHLETVERPRRRLKMDKKTGAASIQVGMSARDEWLLLQQLADSTEHVSFCDLFYSSSGLAVKGSGGSGGGGPGGGGLGDQIHVSESGGGGGGFGKTTNSFGNDVGMQPVYIALATWGHVQTLPFETGGEKAVEQLQLTKSQLQGWDQRTKYRRKLISGMTRIPLRGPAFVDVATLFANVVTAYNGLIKGKRCQEAVELATAKLKDHGLLYSDCQDLWKCARLPAGGTMPNPRGNYSLKKLLDGVDARKKGKSMSR